MGLIGKTVGVQSAVEPVAAAIAGKHSPGAISAVGGRRETDDEQPRLRIAEARQRLGPIGLTLIAARRYLRDPFAPAHQARTFAAANNGLIELSEGHHR